MNEFSSIYITSACISGPIIDGIFIGPCVNEEYDNGSLKVFTGNDDFDELDDDEFDDEIDYHYYDNTAAFGEHVFSNDDINSKKDDKYCWKTMVNDDDYFYENEDEKGIQIEEIRREIAADKPITNKKSILERFLSY
jgi:hypothetical protein